MRLWFIIICFCFRYSEMKKSSEVNILIGSRQKPSKSILHFVFVVSFLFKNANLPSSAIVFSQQFLLFSLRRSRLRATTQTYMEYSIGANLFKLGFHFSSQISLFHSHIFHIIFADIKSNRIPQFGIAQNAGETNVE